MFNSIGFTAQKDRDFWLGALQNCEPQQIIEAPFGGAVPQTPVEAWLVAPDKSVHPDVYGVWLRSLNAPILLITPHTNAAFRLADAIPYLAFICHPLQAGYDIHDLLYLASYRTSGVHVVDAPQEWRMQTLQGGNL